MKKILFVFYTILSLSVFSQRQLSSSEIKLALKKINTLGSVLYVAAHPDDENTRLIAYMANEQLARTAYLSLTRGDGGQNLIGTEKGPLMGLLRTQELLEARKIDGGEQYFTRAVDFGYSKTAEETFTKWDKKKILADVVWTIRKYKPDVMITRFPPTKRAGHGHHTASAILAEEAFDLAADPSAYPEQLKYVSVWKTKRLFLNTSTWWDKELPQKAKNNPEKYTTIDIGAYNTLLGKSYAEIAAESRTMHKSQGFGSAKQRGSKLEYLELIKGDKITNNIFDGVDISWNRVKNTKDIQKLINEANLNFDIEHPEKTVPTLIKAYQLLDNIAQYETWKITKKDELQKLIIACAGIYAESIVKDYTTTENNKIEIINNIVNRSNLNVELVSISEISTSPMLDQDSLVNTTLKNNQLYTIKNKTISPNDKQTNPYWLNKKFKGIYHVESQLLIGTPENKPSLKSIFKIKINGTSFNIIRPVEYKWTDRVKGEIYRPFVVLPKITANIADNIYIFSSSTPKEIRVSLKAHEPNLRGIASLNLPKGWISTPKSISYELANKNEEKILVFNVTPPNNESTGEVKVKLDNINTTVKSLTTIEYDHVTIQTLLPVCKANLVRLNVITKGKKIGYIKGAGDEIPVALKQLGYVVTSLNESTIKNSDLSQYDAIVCGIRAYNTNKYMKDVYSQLMNYVKNGGNYIVQYNTNRGVDTKTLSPYPLKLSRDRVTVEEASPIFLAPEHPILNTPNKITNKDFDNWVQERGLYFPNEWDNNYTPIIGWNDPNEKMTKGSLLVANHGKGSFIYTGISFFRELPAGVPGAFKLFANIISYGK